MSSSNLKSAFFGFFVAFALCTAYAFSNSETAPPAARSLSDLSIEVPVAGWTDLGGAIYSPSEGIYQVIYGDFGNGDEFSIVEVVGFD